VLQPGAGAAETVAAPALFEPHSALLSIKLVAACSKSEWEERLLLLLLLLLLLWWCSVAEEEEEEEEAAAGFKEPDPAPREGEPLVISCSTGAEPLPLSKGGALLL